MAPMFAAQATGRGATSVDRDDPARTTDVDLAQLRSWIQVAILESGWSFEASAVEKKKDKGYISRVLSGEKPLSAAFICGLPDDIEALVAKQHAESFGLIVVRPSTGAEALRDLVSGLVGVLTHAAATLPAKAGAPLKAKLPMDGSKRRSA